MRLRVPPPRWMRKRPAIAPSRAHRQLVHVISRGQRRQGELERRAYQGLQDAHGTQATHAEAAGEPQAGVALDDQHVPMALVPQAMYHAPRVRLRMQTPVERVEVRGAQMLSTSGRHRQTQISLAWAWV